MELYIFIIVDNHVICSTNFRYLQQLSLPQSFIPVVVYNGAIAAEYTLNTDNQTLHKRILHSNPVPKKDTIRLINFAAERGLLLQYYGQFIA